jgi:uncharacterized CHY-type Zn-finger protein
MQELYATPRAHAVAVALAIDVEAFFSCYACPSDPPARTARTGVAPRHFRSITVLCGGCSGHLHQTTLTASATGTYIDVHELRSATPCATRPANRKLDVGFVPQQGRGLLAPRTAYALLCNTLVPSRSAHCPFVVSRFPSSARIRRCGHRHRRCDALASSRGRSNRSRGVRGR